MIALILKNPLAAGLIAVCLSLSVYAGAQKLTVWKLEKTNLKLKVEIVDCNSAINNQNAQIEALGKELAHAKRRSQDAHRRNAERLAGAQKRIKLIRRVPFASDCSGAISRFADQLGGEVW